MAWNIGAILVKFKADTTDWVRGHSKIKGDIRAMGRQITALGAAITGFALVTVREFGKFDRAIREATAVTAGLTEGEFQQMSQMAKEMAVELNKSFTESAKGFYYLGSAGLSAKLSAIACTSC